jgi:predicted ATP-grasp superfamily ATP-dependent carboligase
MPETASTPVLILKSVRDLTQHGGLGIARSLGRLGVPVYWAYTDPRAPALRSRYVRSSFSWAAGHDRPERAVERLLEIGRELGRPAILIPIDDGGSVLVDEYADALAESFLFPRQPQGLARRLGDKREMYAICLESDVPAPGTAFPQSREDVVEFAARAVFPIVLKPAAAWLPQRGAVERRVTIAKDADELLRAYDEMENPETPNTLVQEYIPGTRESNWMFNGYFDEHSECLLGFTGHKIRQHPPYTGATTLGICAENPTVAEMTERLMKALGYRGILDIGYRHDARDGLYKLVDVNPRIGATFRLFVGEDGMDVVRALYHDLTGQPVAGSAARAGRKWLVEHLDAVSSLRYRRDGTLRLGEWLRSFAGVEEAAWFARDDARPFVALGVYIARKALGGAARPAPAAQPTVEEYFEAESAFWDDIYRSTDVYGVIHQERRRRALGWIDGLGLQPGARVLEVGCGTGPTAVALAERGLDVDATDAVPRMLELTREKAEQAGVGDRLRVQLADVHALGFDDSTFDLALALGVMPWLHSPATALRELARVLRPRGYLIVNADNRARLTHLLDPKYNPALAPARAGAKVVLEHMGLRRDGTGGPATTPYRRREFDRLLASASLEKVASAVVGFGPFTFLGRDVLPPRVAVGVHRHLQRQADRGVPVLQATGAQYLVLARKPAPRGA